MHGGVGMTTWMNKSAPDLVSQLANGVTSQVLIYLHLAHVENPFLPLMTC